MPQAVQLCVPVTMVTRAGETTTVPTYIIAVSMSLDCLS